MIKFILLFLTIVKIICGDLAGVKIGINQTVLSDLKTRFLPSIFPKFQNISIPDQNLSVNIYLGTLHLNLSQINIILDVNKLTADTFALTFSGKDKIQLNAKNISGSGSFGVKLKWITTENDVFNIQIKSISANIVLQFTTIESKIDAGKLLPSVLISDVNVDLDFDFSVTGGFFGKLINLFKSKVITMIQSKLKAELKDTIIAMSKPLIEGMVENNSVYRNLTENGIAFDYSLLSPPQIENDMIVINVNGAIVNLNENETKQSPYVIKQLPNFSEGKNIQIQLSDYALNTALNTFFQSGLFKINISSDDIASNSTIQLNTTTLDIFFNGLSAHSGYDKDRKIKIGCVVSDSPMLNITPGLINTTLDAQCSLFIDTLSSYDQALKFNTSIYLEATFNLQNNGVVVAHANKVELRNSVLLENKITGADIQYVQQIFNFATPVAIPMANAKLQGIVVPLKPIYGISLNDSLADIQDAFVNIQTNPQFVNDAILNFVLKKIEDVKMTHKIINREIKVDFVRTLEFLQSLE